MLRLVNGQTFPDLQLRRVGGGTVSLPGDLAGDFGVVLVYRGSWCPYCKGQLAAFSRAKESLDKAGARVVALSVDDEKTSTELAEKLRLTFRSRTARTPSRWRQRPAHTSTTTLATCSRPASCSHPTERW